MSQKPTAMKKMLSIVLATSWLFVGCQDKPLPQSTPTSAPAVSASPQSTEESTGLTGALQADVQLQKESFRPGDEIEVMAVATGLKDSAWVGVIPSAIPHGKEADNDANDLGYKHLKDQNRLILVAPTKPGKYDVRLNDSDEDGVELASRSFTVEEDPAPVKQAKILWEVVDVTSGDELKVGFEVPLSYSESAWLGIVPTDTAHGEEAVGDPANLGYEYLGRRSRGNVILKAPSEVGNYDLRIYDDDADGKEAASVSFTVK